MKDKEIFKAGLCVSAAICLLGILSLKLAYAIPAAAMMGILIHKIRRL